MTAWLTTAIAAGLAVILVIMIAVSILASTTNTETCSRLGTQEKETPYYVVNPDTINDPAYWRDPFVSNPFYNQTVYYLSNAWDTRLQYAADLEALKCPVVGPDEFSPCLYVCAQTWRMNWGIPILFQCEDAGGMIETYADAGRWTSLDSCLFENVADPGSTFTSATECLDNTVERLQRSDYLIPKAPPEVDDWGAVCMDVIEAQQEAYRVLAIAVTLIVIAIILAAIARLFTDK